MSLHQSPNLEQLLRRNDIWRGHSERFVQRDGVDSGYKALNLALQGRGLRPNGGLIDIYQHFHASEWLLFHPAIQQLQQHHQDAYIALISPPALPYINALKQLGIDSTRLLVITPNNAQELVSSFVETCQSSAFIAVFSWLDRFKLRYPELRKLQLASSAKNGIHVIFRPLHSQQQNFPAHLRLRVNITTENLELNIFKQKGQLQARTVTLALPKAWQALPAHHNLMLSEASSNAKPSHEQA